MIEKPKYTEPCNHCGLCCTLELCYVGEKAFPLHSKGAPCPALVRQDDGRMLCKLVVVEQSVFSITPIANALGVGFGCSMEDENTTPEQVSDFERASEQRFKLLLSIEEDAA